MEPPIPGAPVPPNPPKLVHLWDLSRGDTFVFPDDPKVELLFLGMDGMYARVKAMDPEINKRMCANYDAHSDFFAIMSPSPVRLVVPEAFRVEELVDQGNVVVSEVFLPPPPGPATTAAKKEEKHG